MKGGQAKDRENAIRVAIIGFFGIVVGALLTSILTPVITKWVNTSEPATASAPLPIEQIPFTIYPFDGDDDPSCCVGQSYFKYTIDENLIPVYGLNYVLPENEPRHGYAGIAFVFEQSQDFSDFKALEFSVNFGENSNQVDVSMEDITLAEADFHITGSENQSNAIVVPIVNFKGIDLKAVRSIEFQVNSTYASRTNWIDLSHIRLTRK